MGVIVKIKGDFEGKDLATLESYMKALVQEMTGEPIGRVVYHGVVKPDVNRLREQFSLQAR